MRPCSLFVLKIHRVDVIVDDGWCPKEVGDPKRHYEFFSFFKVAVTVSLEMQSYGLLHECHCHLPFARIFAFLFLGHRLYLLHPIGEFSLRAFHECVTMNTVRCFEM